MDSYGSVICSDSESDSPLSPTSTINGQKVSSTPSSGKSTTTDTPTRRHNAEIMDINSSSSSRPPSTPEFIGNLTRIPGAPSLLKTTTILAHIPTNSSITAENHNTTIAPKNGYFYAPSYSPYPTEIFTTFDDYLYQIHNSDGFTDQLASTFERFINVWKRDPSQEEMEMMHRVLTDVWLWGEAQKDVEGENGSRKELISGYWKYGFDAVGGADFVLGLAELDKEIVGGEVRERVEKLIPYQGARIRWDN